MHHFYLNLRLHDVCRVLVLFGQRMTHARGGVSDTLPWGSNPAKSSGRTAGWRLLGAVHVPSSVGALRCADSGRRRWMATHTLTRGRACASRGGRCGVQVASRQVVVPVRSYRSPTTTGISSRIARTLQGRSRVGRRAQGGSREGQVSPSQAGGAGPILDVGT